MIALQTLFRPELTTEMSKKILFLCSLFSATKHSVLIDLLDLIYPSHSKQKSEFPIILPRKFSKSNLFWLDGIEGQNLVRVTLG